MSVTKSRNMFKSLFLRKIKDKGYKSIRDFTDKTGIARSPITKTIRGINVPSMDTVNHWCESLDCTPQERKEIFQSIYVPSDDEERPATLAS
jgi:transcriptional regulator with XRE-family HTH domain